MLLPLDDEPLETVEVLRDPYVLVKPKGSPLQPSLRAIAAEPLVGFRQSDALAGVEAAFRAEGVEPHWAFRSNDNPTVQGLVGAGIGNAVLPRLTVDERDPRVEVVDLPSVPPRIIGIARHRDRYASPATRAFLKPLLDGDGLRQVPRLVDVQPAQPRDAIREELERQDRQCRLQERRRLRHVDHVVRVVLDVLVARRIAIAMTCAPRARVSWMFETILS